MHVVKQNKWIANFICKVQAEDKRLSPEVTLLSDLSAVINLHVRSQFLFKEYIH